MLFIVSETFHRRMSVSSSSIARISNEQDKSMEKYIKIVHARVFRNGWLVFCSDGLLLYCFSISEKKNCLFGWKSHLSWKLQFWFLLASQQNNKNCSLHILKLCFFPCFESTLHIVCLSSHLVMHHHHRHEGWSEVEPKKTGNRWDIERR